MPIDDCKYTFLELATIQLTGYVQKLKNQEKYEMSMFFTAGVGSKTVLKDIGLKKDFSGCYIFYKNNHPVYTGISKKVIQRLVQHVNGKTHFDASLAYRITKSKPLGIK